MIQQKVKEYCNRIGLDTIGFIRCREFNELREFYKERKILSLENEFEESDIEKRINPNIYMKEGKTIISIAFPYLWYKEKNNNGFSLYTKGNDYHRVLKKYLDNICSYIKELGGEAISLVDSNALPERYIAYLAGIGFIGKNNMIITEKYGSFVFLGEIITNLEIYDNDLGSFQDIATYKKCNECNKCINECPTKAINLLKKNSNICSSYITQKKTLNDKEVNLLKNKIFGCDICQLACPYNQEVHFSNIDDFKQNNFMCEEDSEIYAVMDNSYFKEKIAKTSCGWRGKNIIKRNAITKLFNEGKDLSKFRCESPYINEWIDYLETLK